MQPDRTHRLFRCALPILMAGWMVGCGKSPPAEFRLNMPYLVSKEMTDVQQEGIANTLGALYGTPDAPLVPTDSGLNAQRLSMAAGPVSSDQDGTKRGLYRRHCTHCHGVSGDGRGPTAMFLNPYPRDYRLGLFKFKSTVRASKPTDDDLRQILVEGIPGTAMPSFKLLPEDEIDSLIEYVKYLAMRGQTEIGLADYAALEMFDDETDEPLPFDFETVPDLTDVVMEVVGSESEKWGEASEQMVRPDLDVVPDPNRSPEELAASVVAGRTLFFGTKANCFTCHGPTALGDGQQTDDWNDWNKPVKEFVEKTEGMATSITAEAKEMDKDESAKAYHLLSLRQAVAETLFPVRSISPRNLRAGVYRGGRRPLDLYWRVHEGINGTPMPGTGSTLTQGEIWQIVDYVRSLPYEPASRPQKQLPAVARERL